MKKNIVKKFGQFVKENYHMTDNSLNNNSFNIGDLVWGKEEGFNGGLVGLVVSDSYIEDGEECYDIYYRGYNGDTLSVYSRDLKELINSGNMYIAEEKNDIYAYESIAKKLGITLNPKYKEYIEQPNDDEDFYDDSNLIESKNKSKRRK